MLIRLLFIEDDPAQQTLLRDAVSDWHEKDPYTSFELEIVDDHATALEQLERIRFDAALIDLRLPGGDARLSGNDLADVCIRQYGIPAAIISGHPADFDRKIEGHEMFAVFDKGDADPYSGAVAWVAGLSQMIQVLEGTKKKIREQGATVFLRRVWPRWAKYMSLKGIDGEQLIGIVSRQYASHISDSLGVDTAENVNWHPFENYIQPALLDARPHTGDIFKFEDGLWVVLTPQCDMATAKIDTVLLAYCDAEAPAEEWAQNVEALKLNASKKSTDKARGYFAKLVNQAEPALHFLPPLESEKPLIVQFKKLRTIPLESIQASLANRIASVASPFLGNLTQRFGAYVSRVGQPNIDINYFF